MRKYKHKFDHFNSYWAYKFTGDIVYLGFCRWASSWDYYRLTFSLFGYYLNFWFKKEIMKTEPDCHYQPISQIDTCFKSEKCKDCPDFY